MRTIASILFAAGTLGAFVVRLAGDAGAPAASWTFDGPVQAGDSIRGFTRPVAGISGKAMRFDGETSAIIRPAAAAPKLTGAFSIEAWIAIQAYPWTWCAVVAHERDGREGFSFGIDADGRFGLDAMIGGERRAHTSKAALPLYKWNHIAAVFDPEVGIALYLNGVRAGMSPARGELAFAPDADLYVGRNDRAILLAHAVRAPLPIFVSFDGLLDEVNVYDRALDATDVKGRFAAVRVPATAPLRAAPLPLGIAAAPGPFGAHYTRLRFTDEWENSWRIGEHADVLVRFDQAPYRFVFWRGTNYIPCWVTENGIWYTHEFLETHSTGDKTTAEPMADKQARFSHVRVIESHPARAVVHWRYAPVDVEYRLAHRDAITGWHDWADEYYYLYPDGSGVRKVVCRSSRSDSHREFQESIVVNAPGTRPEDNIETQAITIANMRGESAAYSWQPEAPPSMARPQDANIHVVNLKARYKPFVIVPPRNVRIAAYRNNEIRRERSIFPWWNHWPVAGIPSTGRWAVAPDRVSHSSLTHIYWDSVERTDLGETKLMLHGMTDEPAAALVPLAESWLSPPELRAAGPGIQVEGYDPAQRAYVTTADGTANVFRATLHASDSSRAVNPAIVIKGWRTSAATVNVNVNVNGRPLTGGDVRIGHVPTLDGDDLVVWIRLRTNRPVAISIAGRQAAP
jgi:hypothetical protein